VCSLVTSGSPHSISVTAQIPRSSCPSGALIHKRTVVCSLGRKDRCLSRTLSRWDSSLIEHPAWQSRTHDARVLVRHVTEQERWSVRLAERLEGAADRPGAEVLAVGAVGHADGHLGPLHLVLAG